MTNREHWKAMLPIIQAYVDGETIEFIPSHGDQWEPCSGYDFSCDVSQYRIKPKPTAEDYAAAQAKCGIAVGDLVRVARAAENGEQGWCNSWNFYMSATIGSSGRVDDLGSNGMRISFPSTPIGSGYKYPYFVLEKLETVARPFANAEEFAPHRDRWFKVMRISDSGFTRFADYDDAGIVTTSGVRQTWEELFKNFTFEDGTPCGIVERVIRRATT